jgi:mannose/fructose-specific phosphotransferase system component IIA
LIGHGQFATGVYHALRLIVGEVGDLEIASTEGKARSDIEQLISDARARSGGRPLIVFTDLQGGCSSTICGSLLRECATVAIVAGANLPMLLKFVQYRDQLPFRELYDLVVEAGRDGVRGLKEPG